MNCRRRGPATAKKPDDPNKKGNGVASYGDKSLMERHTIEKRPYWEDAPAIITTDAAS